MLGFETLGEVTLGEMGREPAAVVTTNSGEHRLANASQVAKKDPYRGWGLRFETGKPVEEEPAADVPSVPHEVVEPDTVEVFDPESRASLEMALARAERTISALDALRKSKKTRLELAEKRREAAKLARMLAEIDDEEALLLLA